MISGAPCCSFSFHFFSCWLPLPLSLMIKVLASLINSTYSVPNPLISSYFRKDKRHKRQTAPNWYPVYLQTLHGDLPVLPLQRKCLLCLEPTGSLCLLSMLTPPPISSIISLFSQIHLRKCLPYLKSIPQLCLLLKLPYFPSFHFCSYFLPSSPQSPHSSFSPSCFAGISFKRSPGTSGIPDLKASLHYSSSFT